MQIQTLFVAIMTLLGVNALKASTYPYTVPSLPYSYDALEPHIDTLTMKIHHDKHHQTYVDNLNEALKKAPDLQKKSLVWLLKNLDSIPTSTTKIAVQNNAGGHWNHSFFWQIMSPTSKKKPHGQLEKAITNTFGSFDAFKEQFNAEAKKVFGSGWAWLCRNPEGTLVIMSTKNQDSPISQNLIPIIGLDVWEHAYYLKYQNKRPDYIKSWWNVVNWDQAEKNFKSKV